MKPMRYYGWSVVPTLALLCFALLCFALLAVLEERAHQEKKWGQQDHVPLKWMMILQEELGETAKAILEADDEWDEEQYRAEMIQVAAVALAALESYDRRQGTWTCSVEHLGRKIKQYE